VGYRQLMAGRSRESPWALDEIAQNRFDANDIGEIEAIISVEQGVSAPGEAIREYRVPFQPSAAGTRAAARARTS